MKNTICFLFLAFFINNTISAQCISGDCKNGKGIYMYPSGAKYIGEFKDGEIHGIGTCYYTDGSKYQGEWNFRFPQGNGTKTFADGSSWTGLWEKGERVDESGDLIEDIITAKGEANDDGTDIQSGCISGDCSDGEGIFAYPDGSKYEGQFKEGNIDGWGTWYYTNGDKYIGTFKNNFSHGKGTIYHPDGKKTTGEWIEGEYIGNSTAKLGREGCIKGDCTNGKGTYIYKGGSAKYVGSFKNELAHGKGICYYDNNERYEGEWENGSFNGRGTLFFEDGSEVSGLWENGIYKNGTESEMASFEMDIKDEEVADEKVEEIIVEEDSKIEEVVKETVEEIITSSEAPDLKVWAVVIGVSSYNHMPVLKYTDDDAYRMYAFLKSPEGGALSDDQISILIDEDATKENIKKTMASVFSKARSNDLIMLYFSGHGLKGSFLPIDFDGFNNKLLHDEVNEIFAKSPAKYKLCIADACHSGSLLAMRSGTVENALSKYYSTLAQAEAGTALIMSSKSEETSLESSGLRQGVFSHFLIKGLKGEADKNTDEIVSIQELYEYIFDNVRSYTGNRQSPVIKGDYDEKMTVSVKR